MSPPITRPPSHIDGFDRVRFRLDHPIRELALKRLALLCRHVSITGKGVDYQAQWLYDLDVLQPHAQSFSLALVDALPAGASCELYYVEVARDYPTRFQIEAMRMAWHYVGHALLRYSRGRVTAVGGGYYYNPKDASTRLALYGDRKTKQFSPAFGLPALHTELRFEGVEALAREGLRGPLDLAAIDYDEIWNRHLSFWSLPASQTALGEALGCRSSRKDSLQRAARTIVARDGYCKNGTFALQKLIARHREVENVVQPLTFKQWQRSARSAALMPTWFSSR